MDTSNQPNDYLVIRNSDLVNIITQTINMVERHKLAQMMSSMSVKPLSTEASLPEVKPEIPKEVKPEIPKEVKSEVIKKEEPEKAKAKKIMNVQEVAKYLSYSAPTIYKYVRENTIPSHKKGKKLLFYQTEIDEWLNSDD